MKKININKYILLMSVVLFSACEDFLMEDPKGLLAPENFYESINDADAGVIGIYDVLSRNGFTERNIYYLTDIASDDFWTKDHWQYSEFEVTADEGQMNPTWNNHYVLISRANTAIQSIPEVSGDQAVIDDLLGEAMFMRAFAYFNLVRWFGDVPFSTEPLDDPQNLSQGRTEVSVIYDQIIEDLTFASEHMMTKSERGKAPSRIGRGAAQTMLAYVYLTRASTSMAGSDDYQKAMELTQAVIDSEEYGLFPEYGQAFAAEYKNGMESLFASQSIAAGAPHNRMNLTLRLMPQINGTSQGPYGGPAWSSYSVTEDLYNSFEAGDVRKDVYMVKDSIQLEDGTWAQINQQARGTRIYSLKYREPEMVGSRGNVNYPWLRYADVLLVHAEAANEVNGPTLEAYNSINAVRNRSELDDLPLGLTKEQFREAVWQERRHELVFENKRFFDLKRMGRLKERVEAAKPGVTVQLPKHLLFPIPQNEMDANTSLVENNPGY